MGYDGFQEVNFLLGRRLRLNGKQHEGRRKCIVKEG